MERLLRGQNLYLEQGPYALIRSQNVYNDGFHRDGLAFIGEHHAAELDGVEVSEGDVVLNITGDSVARVCQVACDVLPARTNQHVAIVRPRSEYVDAGYLRYHLVAQDLKQAMATYTESGGTGQTAVDKEEAVAVMLEKHEVCSALFHGFDWSKWTEGASQERLGLLPAAQEHILAREEGKERCLNAVCELSQAFALAAAQHPETLRIRDDVGFFQAVRAALSKRAITDARPEEELDLAVRQIISRAVSSEGVMDIFTGAGLDRPDILALSDDFLAEVRGMPHRNLAVELLRKLPRGEVSTRRRKNVVQARSFAEMLEQTLRRYQKRAIEAAQVIEELIELAKDMREASTRGERLGLSEDELAFYDVLETDNSAVQVLSDETLRDIARQLVKTVRSNVTIGWTLRENVRAHLRVLVRRILRRHGYPPDKREKATRTVLEQAEVLSEGWALA